jgi:uncharacterized protein (TIGR02246 family)
MILGALLAAFAAPIARAMADEVADPVTLLQAQVTAWNRGDLAAFCEVYADDATFLSPSGLTRGRQAVLDRYRKRYPDKAAMGSLALDPIETRPTPTRDATVVSIAAHWSLSYPDKPVASGLTLLVMHRIGARWQIVQDASF